MSIITTAKDLKALVQRLQKEEYITVDTEFIRERTYWPHLCLIQVAGGQDAAAIDPLAEGMDLTPFFDLMADKNVLKVFHACRQDMEIFFKAMGKLPAPVFDTQVAAMVCGFGEQVSYENLVGSILKKTLDKSSRFTDWARRPLTPKQMKYALADVTHLRPIYEHLRKRLEDKDRMGWIRDEMRVLTSRKTYQVLPEEAWQRVRVPGNKPRTLGILRELAAWREALAQKADVPRGRILKDEALAEIATHPPKTAEALAQMRNVSQGFAESGKGAQILEAVRRGLELPESELPAREARTQLPAGIGPVVDLLRVFLKTKCAEEGVAQKLLCSAADLELIAAYGAAADVAAMKGWRRKVFGADAVKLCAGELALGIKGGRVFEVGTPPQKPETQKTKKEPKKTKRKETRHDKHHDKQRTG